MEGKTNFSRCLKQFDGLTCLIRLPPYFTPLGLGWACPPWGHASIFGRHGNPAERWPSPSLVTIENWFALCHTMSEFQKVWERLAPHLWVDGENWKGLMIRMGL